MKSPKKDFHNPIKRKFRIETWKKELKWINQNEIIDEKWLC